MAKERERHYDGDTLEIDILAFGKTKDNLKVALIIEVKTTMGSRVINQLNTKIEKFPKFFEDYKDYPIIGVVAGFKYTEVIRKEIENAGFYVLIPSGDIVKIANSPEFKPKVFNV